jgi:ankyrin repeat protein
MESSKNEISVQQDEDEIIIQQWLKYFDLPQKEMRKQLKQLDFTSTTSQNQNILHIACKNTKKQSIEIILSINSSRLEKKLDLNLKDKLRGWTPLYYLLDASDGSEVEILQILIKSGSSINISDIKGITPLHLVSFKGQDEYMSILLQNNADINALDSYGRLPLNYAIMEGQLNSAYLLLEAKSKIDVNDIDGNSLLHYAVSSKGNSLLFSIMLIDRKINLNAQNDDGDTPLMLVAKKNPKENVRLIKKLIDSGAKYKNIINYKCQSFLSLMGEAALKDKYNEEIDCDDNNKYKCIDVEKENKIAEEKMEEYIKKKYKNKKNSNMLLGIIIPFIILIVSYIINNYTFKEMKK